MSDPILELLQKNGLGYSVSGRDYLIKCLNPEHEDNNPSFRIDRVLVVGLKLTSLNILGSLLILSHLGLLISRRNYKNSVQTKN
jgi:hypothetical protein